MLFISLAATQLAMSTYKILDCGIHDHVELACIKFNESSLIESIAQ